MNQTTNTNRETNEQNAVRAQTAPDVPPNTEYLTPGNTHEARSRAASTSSFYSIVSDASTSGPTPDNAAVFPTSDNEVDKTISSMLAEISVMQKATEKQKNISKDVKEGLKTLRVLLAVLQAARDEAKKSVRTTRHPKRRRNVGDSPESPTDTQKIKKKKAAKNAQLPEIQILDDNGDTAQPVPTNNGDQSQGSWQTVENRKKKKKKKEKRGPRPPPYSNRKAPKQRGGVVLIVPNDGKTYMDVVQTLRTVDTSDNDIDIRGVTKTKAGAVLIRTRGDRGTQGDVSGRLREVLVDQGTVKDMTRKVTLEILDLDCLTEKEEVQDALNKVIQPDTDRKVSVLGPNSRGQKLAICELGDQDATRLLETGHIKIGFVNCRVRTRVMVPRCYKCLGYGHYRVNCKGPDRRDCCWKCGKNGHRAGACTDAPLCFLCPPQGSDGAAHVPGTALCTAFKTALTEARDKSSKVRI